MKMTPQELICDIEKFQKLSNRERKLAFETLYSVLNKIDNQSDSERYRVCLCAIRAIDAMHHLAKDDIYLDANVETKT